MNDTYINPIRRTPVRAPLFQPPGQLPPPCPSPPPLGAVTPTVDLSFRTFDIESVRIGTDDVQAIRGPDGEGYVVLRRMCEVLGIADQSQAVKLKEAPWAATTMIVATAVDGKNYECFCLHVKSVPMWLATIHANKVAEHVRPKLVVFQKEAADALHAWATRKTGLHGTPDLRDPVQAMAILTQSLQLNQEYLARLEVADARLAVAEPKAANHDSLSGAGGGIGTYQAARILRYPPKTFSEWLEIAGYLFRRGRVLEPYADKIAKGFLFLKVDRAKNGYLYTQPMITARGLQHFKDLQLTGKIPIPENKF